MVRHFPESAHRRVFRRGTSGCLGTVVGFVLSALVLIPMWIYWLPSDGSAIGLPTISSLALGVVYAMCMGIVVSIGLRGGWGTAAGFIIIVATVLVGRALGALVRQALMDSCLLGTGPQPDWCHQEDPSYLTSILPAYTVAGALVGSILFLAGKVGEKLHSRLQVDPSST